jgi:hypothetical protein
VTVSYTFVKQAHPSESSAHRERAGSPGQRFLTTHDRPSPYDGSNPDRPIERREDADARVAVALGACEPCGEPLTPGHAYGCPPCLESVYLMLAAVKDEGAAP